ncbi:MAG: DNA translocase FtsK [Treponema sp.]|nr:DNA translocase FtsK [Candidatus Treponema equifaecale]
MISDEPILDAPITDSIVFDGPEISNEPFVPAEEPYIPEDADFGTDDGFAPAEITPAPAEAFIDPSEFLDSKSEDENEDDENDDYIEIEDIFSQMDEDAAENPVMKKSAEPEEIQEPVAEERNFDDPLFRSQVQPEISLEDELNNVEAFDMEEDDEDRSLNGVEGIDDDIQYDDSTEVAAEEDSDDVEIEEPDFSEDVEVNEIDEPDFDQEPDFVEEEELADLNEGDAFGISEEDKNAGIVPEDDPYERKQKRTLASYNITTDILNDYENGEYWVIDEETKQAGENLKQTLNEFGIEAEVTGIRKGPVVTMFEILPAPGVKLGRIVALQDNIALSLAASSVRIIAPIPGKHAVGIEVPNKARAVVSFKEIVSEKLAQFEKMQIPVILGKDISGEPQLIDLAKTPHLLIAGSTGAGKSVCVNSMILSILYKRSPQQVRLVLIDPKVVELKLYNDIPHLLTPVITEPKKALQALQYCLCEMERRYALLDGMGVRDIISYNKKIVERRIATEKLPYIVVIIDEFADLMATTGKELESNVARLAAMSRAVGIHLVLATQRPSVNVITGLIKANIPSRIAFMVASRQDSQIIIDGIGAEKLLGKGDMLYSSATDPFPTRIQGTLVSDDEVERVVNEVKSYGEPEYIDEEIFVDEDEEGSSGPGLFSDGEDPLYDQALQIVIQAGKASASYIQRRLKIGYNRAARLVEEMEERGIVGPANGSKPREVIHMP